MMDKVNDQLNVEMACSNPGDHAPQAERNNGTVENGFHTTLRRTGHSTIPKTMMSDSVETSASGFDVFPVAGGIFMSQIRDVSHRQGVRSQ